MDRASLATATPKPYYERGGITIYCGKAEVILPTLGSFDLLLTDPPYGIGENDSKQKSRQGHGLANQRNYGSYQWDNATPPRWLIDQMRERAKASIVWGGNYFHLPPSSCWLVWDKDNGATDFADCELAWTNLPKAVRRIKWRWQGMLQENAGDKKEARFHPTQKPVAVMSWAIEQAPPECQTILDPFMGSGTTLVAAKRSGKSAIGIEQEERYCQIAVARLQQDILQFSE